MMVMTKYSMMVMTSVVMTRAAALYPGSLAIHKTNRRGVLSIYEQRKDRDSRMGG